MNLEQLAIQNSYCHEYTVINFKDGINYLKGENEAGKSEALSLLAYALYGISALRDKAEAYKNLSVQLIFKVKDTRYKVRRGSKTILQVWKDNKWDNISISTSAVNASIQSLLYEFDIFTLTNYSQQSESEAYNKMTTGERIKFCEKASGVEEAKTLEKSLETRRKELNTLIKSAKENLKITPVDFKENIKLEDILKSNPNIIEDYKSNISRLYSNIDTIKELSILAKSKLDLPTFNFKSFESHTHLLSEILKISEKIMNFDINLLESKTKEYNLIFKKLNSTQETLETFTCKFSEPIEYYEHQRYLLEQKAIYDKRASLLSVGNIECPSCSSSFSLMYKDLDNFKPEIEDFSSLVLKEHLISQALNWKVEEPNYIANKLDLKKQLEDLKHYTIHYEDFKNLKQELKELESYNTSYQNTLNMIVTSNAKIDEKLKDWDVDSLEDKLKVLQSEFEVCNKEKEELVVYQHTRQLFSARQAIIDKFEKDLEDYTAEYDYLVSLLSFSKKIKLEMQQQFIPQLNKKASHIVSHITGGKRFKLEITDTFDIILDNHKINLYSGSAKVIANIAFRLAYIETFYDKSFPVFIGDEVDCYFDANRAKELHSVFDRLILKGYQIVLVSHFPQSNGNIIDLDVIKNDKTIKIQD